MFSSLLAGHALYTTLPNPRYLQLGADAAILPRNARVLVHDAGYLAWVRPDLRIVDLVGLKTPSSAALHARFSAPSGSTRRAIDTIARTSDARILIALSREPFWSAVVTDLDDDGWGLVRLNPADHAYGIFRLTPPPATGYAAP